jgi:hypothetical protein
MNSLLRSLFQKTAPAVRRLILYGGLALWSMGIAWGAAIAFEPPSLLPSNPLVVSEVADPRTLGRDTYLENCASCHIPVPAEVLPTESWKKILETTHKHYGVSIDPPPISLSVRLMWDYLRFASRPLRQDEPVPQLIEQSRFFKALHPKVKLPEEVTLKTCIVCHPSAQEFNYQKLSPEWNNAP